MCKAHEVVLVVYTDGACSGNPGPGGWAWAREDGAWASGAEPHTTNQRMEIMAAFDAVRSADGPLEVVSDSTYVVNCFRDRWWEGWIKRNWLNSKREPVANRDLWEPFVELVRQRDNVTFRWVKGHSGDPMNDLVDALAVAAAQSQKGGEGTTLPDVSRLPADTPNPVGAAMAGVRKDRRLPKLDIATHGVVVLGHRPPELGGYEQNPTSDYVARQLRSVLAAKAEMDSSLVVVSGLRLGAEMLAAEAAVALGLALVVVLPFPNPDRRWPAPQRNRFESLCAAADEVVTLERKVPGDNAAVSASLARRDGWLVRNVASAILVWRQELPVFRRLAVSLEDHLGDEVWIIDPDLMQP